jgi:hypothetical protein
MADIGGSRSTIPVFIVILPPYLPLGRQHVVVEGRLGARIPCWKNLLMTGIYSTVDVNVKRNNVLLCPGEVFPRCAKVLRRGGSTSWQHWIPS